METLKRSVLVFGAFALALALVTTAVAQEKVIDFSDPQAEEPVAVEPIQQAVIEVVEQAPQPKIDASVARKLTEEESEAEAHRLLAEQVRVERLRQNHDRFMSEHHTKAGITQFDALHFDAAKGEFEKALQHNPNNIEAKEYLRKTRMLLGLSEARFVDIYGGVRRDVLVERELALRKMKVGFNKAKEHLDNNEYQKAIDMFSRVRELVRWVEPYYEVGLFKVQSEDYLRQAEVALEEQKVRDLEESRRRAAEVARLNAEHLREREQTRMARLIGSVRDLLAQARYKEAQILAEEILKLDPQNREAVALREAAFRAGHRQMVTRTADAHTKQTLISWAYSRQAQVPYSTVLVYPDNWAEIVKREIEAISAETDEPQQWMGELRGKLEQKISFDFVETPLQDVVLFLQQITNAAIILDPRAVFDRGSEVTLKVTDMELSKALEWILKLVDLGYTLRDNAIFISDHDSVAGEPVLKLYDVTDVTLEIRDFPGDLNLLRQRTGNANEGGGDGGFQGAGIWDVGGGDKQVFDADALMDLIKRTIAPGTWDIN